MKKAKLIKINKEIIDVIKNEDFFVDKIEQQDEDFYVPIHQHTPLGEDWYETFWFDGTNEGLIQSIKDRYNSFDIDEEAEPLIKMRGQYGIPNSIKDLIEDAEWKEEMLSELVRKLDSIEI